ncbi:MAG: cysteine methyltransferase [Deltaproteobacteria bacterium]|nr:MAG: cysteine methyltransferase [Deltaproteobacteria bacterium]
MSDFCPPDTSPFCEAVYRVVRRIPSGCVATYGDVAAALGHPRAARRVGWALSRLSPERSVQIPWQRVINAQGMISLRDDPVRGPLQRRLLEQEGIRFDERGRCDLPSLRCLPEDLDP